MMWLPANLGYGYLIRTTSGICIVSLRPSNGMTVSPLDGAYVLLTRSVRSPTNSR